MTKKVAIINIENSEILEAIQQNFKNKDIEISYFETLADLQTNEISYNLICLCDFTQKFSLDINSKQNVPIINLHPSLLPSFAEENALEKSFTGGIKVGGITIHQVEPNKFYGNILAQYPVLIGLTTHYEEYKQEIINISKKLYPAVIEAILEDRVFDFSDLFKHSCSGGCGSCNGGHCSH